MPSLPQTFIFHISSADILPSCLCLSMCCCMFALFYACYLLCIYCTYVYLFVLFMQFVDFGLFNSICILFLSPPCVLPCACCPLWPVMSQFCTILPQMQLCLLFREPLQNLANFGSLNIFSVDQLNKQVNEIKILHGNLSV